MDKDIRIERVPVKDLPALADRLIDSAAPGSYVPITKARAHAQVHNPFAAPEDLGLLLAWQGERVVGYFGVLPVMLAHEGELHKVLWFTTWSVHPSMLGQGVGSGLMANALELAHDYAIVGSAPARHVSAKFGLQEVARLDYARIDFRLVGCYNPLGLLLRLLRKLFHIVGFKLKIEGLQRALERAFEALFGWLLRPPLRAWALAPYRRQLNGLHIDRVQRVTPSAPESSDPNHTGFYRDSRVVNWMLAHPWLVPSGQSPTEGLDYGFTDARPFFEQIAWQLSDGSGANQGYIVFQFSPIEGSRVLKVLDHHLFGAAEGQAVPLALKMAHMLRADVIEGPIALAGMRQRGWMGRLLVEVRQRICQVHAHEVNSPMARARDQLQQSYVDGDTAFA
jgi:GNAT superfamily N-acetyltransferase